MGGVVDPKIHPLTHAHVLVQSLLRRTSLILAHRIPPFKVIGTDPDRSATYELKFHSNGLAHTVYEINGDFSPKMYFFHLGVRRPI